MWDPLWVDWLWWLFPFCLLFLGRGVDGKGRESGDKDLYGGCDEDLNKIGKRKETINKALI